ncbi:hypothetical protein ARMSODRAFT_776685 [Armillaria solidipes]|uniref:Uncharacterized protein n=1 Tax=Armillaria solidipes TaxID=1076256 RepID=A0A2H3B0N2_9AGAR|nr:hypothetical protein ARMSODRAFT_776685 [Armillaria solidipes]
MCTKGSTIGSPQRQSKNPKIIKTSMLDLRISKYPPQKRRSPRKDIHGSATLTPEYLASTLEFMQHPSSTTSHQPCRSTTFASASGTSQPIATARHPTILPPPVLSIYHGAHT